MDRFEGVVRKKRIAGGSKSDRAAVVLVTSEHEYVLRRRGGNPFADPTLEKLIGKRVSFVGEVHGYTLIVSGWVEVAGKAAVRDEHK